MLNEKTAGFYGFKTSDAFSISLKKYFVSERVSKVDSQVWVTAVTLWYWRLVAVDYKHDWLDRYDKAHAWLKLHLKGDAQLEEEILESAKKFVVEKYKVEKEVFAIDESFVSAQKEKKKVLKKVKKEEKKRLLETKIGKHYAIYVNIVHTRLFTHDFTFIADTTVKITRAQISKTVVLKHITCYHKEGYVKIDNEFAKLFTFDSAHSFETSLRGHFKSERVSKLDIRIIGTAVSLWYLRLVAVDHRVEWESSYKRSYAWLSAQINDAKLEQEVHEFAKTYIIKRYQVDDESIKADASFEGTFFLSPVTKSI